MLFALALPLLAGPGGSIATPPVQAIIEKSVAANQVDWQALPEYSYRERDRDHHGDRTYEVSMISGSPYRRLVAIDGSPISQEDQQREQQKLDSEIAHRRNESAHETERRVAAYRKTRRRDRQLFIQLVKAFNFSLLREEKLGGFDVYVLSATRRPGYRPPTRDCEVLLGMEGQLWIDKATYQWVKVEAHVIRPVSIEGFLARVEPGTEFELDKKPVANNVWLPSHFSMRARSRVLSVFPHGEQDDETYSGYRKIEAPQHPGN